MTIFLLAVFEDRLELVQIILQSVMNKRILLNQCDGYGNTALHLAVTANSFPILSILLNEGVKKNTKNKVNLNWDNSLVNWL